MGRLDKRMLCSSSSARGIFEIAEEMEENKRNKREETARNEKQNRENHDNLAALVENTQGQIELLQELNKTLKEQNTLLTKNNESLKMSLDAIACVLHALFDNEIHYDADHKAQMQQVTALACEISETLDRGEKVNWSDKAADGGVQMVIAAIGTFLKLKGIVF